MNDELRIELEDGGTLKLQRIEGCLSLHMQAFHPGGRRKATSLTVLLDEEKAERVVKWMSALRREES